MSELLKQLSTEDLTALQSGDISRVSTEGLKALKADRAREQMRAEMNLNPASGGNNLLAGIGSGMASALRAVGGSKIAESMGLPATKEEANRLDAPLMATTSGKIGRGIGMAAPASVAMLVPGANTYLGATLLGGLTGAALTEGDAGDRAKAGMFSALGGAAGKAVGDLVGKGAQWLMDSRAASRATAQAANAQRDAAAATAREAGFVVPPSDVKPSALNELLNGVSGKIKTAQEASARNQGVTNDMARRALGMQPGDAITAESLQALRNQAAQAYNPVRNSGTVTADKAFTQALDQIASTTQGATRSFPGLVKENGVADMVNSLKRGAFDAGDAVDATKVLRDLADKAFREGDKQTGRAYRAASTALEDQLERHLQNIGAPDALNAFRQARQLIAKSYTVQGAANTQTGDISAQVLAKQLAKGKPLSGDLKTVAEVATAFPKATQSLKEAPKAFSPLDYAVAAMSGTASGNPLALGMMGARPAVRSLILSKPYQNAMMTNTYAPGMLDNLLLPGLLSDMTKRQVTAGGVTAGLLSAQ